MDVRLEPPAEGDKALTQVLQVVGAAPAKAVALVKGEVHSAVFIVQAEAACNDACLGDLVITWKRPKYVCVRGRAWGICMLHV